MRCRRRPSGCVIQEHVESDDSFVHDMYKPAINSGMTFGAWLVALERQCDRLTSVINFNIPDSNVLVLPTGNQRILKVAERIVLGFCATVMSYASAG